ncbi:MAG: hypothetical protein IPH30_10175 [Betaproteobacteria bacterium]|nr:hypothetical protein [Betaproteobacteria bacterium]
MEDEVHPVLGGRAELPLAVVGLPAGATDPRKLRYQHERLAHEAPRIGFALGQLGHAPHPYLEGHADRHEVAGQVGAQPAESLPRAPQHRQDEERAAEADDREPGGAEVLVAGVAHQRDRSQHQDHHQLEDQERVEEVEDLPRVAPFLLEREEHEQQERERKHPVGEERYRIRNDLVAQDETGHRPQEHHGGEVEERDEVEAAAARGLLGEHLSAEDAQEHAQPRDDQPARQEVEDRPGDREQQHDREPAELRFRREERLPEQEEAEVHEKPDALEVRFGVGDEPCVQGEEHREHHPAAHRAQDRSRCGRGLVDGWGHGGAREKVAGPSWHRSGSGPSRRAEFLRNCRDSGHLLSVQSAPDPCNTGIGGRKRPVFSFKNKWLNQLARVLLQVARHDKIRSPT